ncbi:MAG: hypothetical protein U0X76_01550 [Bacteroidia bacterium]
MNKKLRTFTFIFADWLAAVLAWALFFVYRKTVIEHLPFDPRSFSSDPKLFYGLLFIPLGWVAIYALIGSYTNVYRKSRLKELGQTLYLSVIGVLIIFFSLLLDDKVISYRSYYHTFFTLLALHFLITATFQSYSFKIIS